MTRQWFPFDDIRAAWCPETGAGTSGRDGDPRGQCAVTALVVQDLLGGELLRGEIKDAAGVVYESHYWNQLPGGAEIDLTRGQYPPDYPLPRGVVVPRSRLLEGERAIAARTPERYDLLARRVIDRQI